MEAAPAVKAMVISAKQYQNKTNSTNLSNLLRQLDILISITNRGAFNTSDFCPRDLLLVDCITCISDFLNNPDVNPYLRNKSVQLLLNLSHDDELGRCLHVTFDLTSVLTSIVVAHRPDSTDPLLIQCIEILQRITYNQSFTSHDTHITPLCTFLVQIIQNADPPSAACLGLLTNLCRLSPALQSHTRNLGNVKSLYKNLARYLNLKNPEIVVYSQSILTSLLLENAAAGQLFSVQNINQIFEYVFNLLVKGQPGYLRAYTVDLLVDLIKSSWVQKALTCFDHIERSIQRVISLVETVKEKSTVKIFELLVEFCALPTLRTIITQSVFQTTNTDDFVGVVVKWAGVNGENLRSAVLALKLLKCTLEEVLHTNTSTLTHSRVDLIIRSLVSNLTSTSQTHLKLRCRVMSNTLELLLDKAELQPMILQYFDATVCTQVLEFQYAHNTLGNVKYDSPFSMENPDEWSEDGVGVALHLLIVMDKLKRLSSDIEQLVHTTLLDARFIPLLACGLTSSNATVVQYGIKLLSMASRLNNFPHVSLSEAMAANVTSQSITSNSQCPSCAHRPPMAPPMKRRQCLVDMATQDNKENPHQTRRGVNRSHDKRTMSDTDDAIESLISSFKSGVELKDMKVTEIIDVYEHKLLALQTKYIDLESLLEAKMAAMAQSDRLIGQHGSRMAQAEAEITQLRGILRSAEKKCEDNVDVMSNATKLRGDLQRRLEDEQQRYESQTEDLQEVQSLYNEQTEELKSVSQNLLSLKETHNGLTNIHDMLTKHHDALKQQHDVLKHQFTEIQDEKRTLSKQMKEGASKLQELTKALKTLKLQHEETTKERDEFEDITGKLQSDLAKAETVHKKLQNQVSSLELVIRDKEKVQNNLHEELSKHAQIAALIHNLSSGNSNIDTSGISK